MGDLAAERGFLRRVCRALRNSSGEGAQLPFWHQNRWIQHNRDVCSRTKQIRRNEICSLSSERGIHMPEGKIKQTDSDKRFRRVMGATTLVGDSVRNTADEDLGKIKELMVDLSSGRIAYAVLSFGGVLNMGNKLFAVPWSVLTLDEDEKQFILDVPKERLENAPGFDKDNWPDMADTGWATRINDYYGAEPYAETTSRERTFRGGGSGL
jgi:hypothetical protein